MKVDLKKELAGYTARRGELALVDIPPRRYLALDGHGDPNTSQAYADALASIYPLAYTLKLLSRRELDRDYVVGPLEALWWAEDLATFTTARDKTQWDWTVMLVVPDWLDAAHVEAAREAAAGKDAPLLDQVRLEELDEGLCVQTLHIGPYDEEGPVLAEIHERFVPSQGLRLRGRHHEIYLATRVAPRPRSCARSCGSRSSGSSAQRPRPSTTSASVSSTRADPGSTSFEPRVPDPMITCSASTRLASTITRYRAGSPIGVMPP